MKTLTVQELVERLQQSGRPDALVRIIVHDRFNSSEVPYAEEPIVSAECGRGYGEVAFVAINVREQ